MSIVCCVVDGMYECVPAICDMACPVVALFAAVLGQVVANVAADCIRPVEDRLLSEDGGRPDDD